jgi:predicted GIY-YIG superfamily endonuclease
VSEPITDWYVYVLVSVGGQRTYVGISTDPARRLEQHNGERPGGARSTRAGRPWQPGRVHGPFETRGEALRIERALKQRRGSARLLPLPSAQNSSSA